MVSTNLTYLNLNFDKFNLINVSKMSNDLQIITVPVPDLEKSAFRLICLWCYLLSDRNSGNTADIRSQHQYLTKIIFKLKCP